jgi:hypothetical protein
MSSHTLPKIGENCWALSTCPYEGDIFLPTILEGQVIGYTYDKRRDEQFVIMSLPMPADYGWDADFLVQQTHYVPLSATFVNYKDVKAVIDSSPHLKHRPRPTTLRYENTLH